MTNYVVFDVETPNRANNRMSAIGITVVRNGKISDSYFSYVDPETHFDRFNTYLTGINEMTVRNAPNFVKLWDEILPIMDNGILVAHNAHFDMAVLRQCLRDYGISWKNTVNYLCTVQIGRKVLPDMKHNLDIMCDHFGITLEHHKADSDSNACAEILIRYMKSGVDVNKYMKEYQL